LDRLSTWDEVRSALSFSSQSAFGPVGDIGGPDEADLDCSGVGWKLSEDTMWLAIISEMTDSKSN
jgi:hypothetical protein